VQFIYLRFDFDATLAPARGILDQALFASDVYLNTFDVVLSLGIH
jgi:hypothetical protein